VRFLSRTPTVESPATLAELRKQPGVGIDATHRMARANTANNFPSGAAQAALCLQRSCASSPVY